MHQTLPLIAIMTAGLLCGTELSVAAFVHPQIAHLDEPAHVQARQRFARLFGALMPIWYAVTTLLTAAVAWSSATSPLHPASLSALLWVSSIAFTLWGPFPINARICSWDTAHPPIDWKADCHAWDRLHLIRLCILLIAFGLLLVACIPGV